MRKKWWKGIKRMLPGALFGSVSVAGINMTVDVPLQDVRIQVAPVINMNCGVPPVVRPGQRVKHPPHPT